ncbi:arginine N-methyltransferase 2-like protein, partial [Metarhizium hybridum]
MCSKRILCRLRLSGRKAPKLSMKSLLLLSLRPLAKCSSQFTEKAKRVIKLLDSWTNHQTLGRLQNVVQGVYELAQIKGVSELLDAIPNREMDPSSRRSLLNMIKKVARYRSSAMFLYRTAKKFPITQAMEAVPVTMPRSAFQNHQPRSIPSLDSFLKDARVFYGQKRDRGQFFRLLQCNEQQASDLFMKQTRKTLSEAKIHAEMQLIFHCEIEQYAPFPRVISSSKDACFLCNAFIQMQGKFYTPRCHGRLYPGWRLPICPETTAFEQQFVDYLLTQARNSIQLLLSRRERTVYPDPNESTVMTIPMSSSTVSCILPETTEAISNPSPELSKTASVIQRVDLGGDTSSQASHLDEEGMSNQERPRSVQSNGVKSSLASSKSTSKAEARPENDDSRALKRETARAIGHINYLPCSTLDLVPLRLTSKDLPFHQRVTMDQIPIQLSYGMLTFLFEFGTVRHGRMSITQQDTICVGTTAPINVMDIPTHSELKVGCSKAASRFSIFISTSVILSFEFVWCEAEAISELPAD